MGTTIRPELSEKNKYWVERRRYYELKYFCLQYPVWKKAYAALDGLSKSPDDLSIFTKSHNVGDPTARCAEARLYYKSRMDMVEQTAKRADEALSGYILKAVTEGVSYSYFKSRLEISCGKETYYESYRRFFWLLNKVRD